MSKDAVDESQYTCQDILISTGSFSLLGGCAMEKEVKCNSNDHKVPSSLWVYNAKSYSTP